MMNAGLTAAERPIGEAFDRFAGELVPASVLVLPFEEPSRLPNQCRRVMACDRSLPSVGLDFSGAGNVERPFGGEAGRRDTPSQEERTCPGPRHHAWNTAAARDVSA